jgi:hypothetical protein
VGGVLTQSAIAAYKGGEGEEVVLVGWSYSEERKTGHQANIIVEIWASSERGRKRKRKSGKRKAG